MKSRYDYFNYRSGWRTCVFARSILEADIRFQRVTGIKADKAPYVGVWIRRI